MSRLVSFAISFSVMQGRDTDCCRDDFCEEVTSLTKPDGTLSVLLQAAQKLSELSLGLDESEGHFGSHVQATGLFAEDSLLQLEDLNLQGAWIDEESFMAFLQRRKTNLRNVKIGDCKVHEGAWFSVFQCIESEFPDINVIVYGFLSGGPSLPLGIRPDLETSVKRYLESAMADRG